MTDLKQAAQMALEALRYPLDTSAKLFDADKAELMNIRAINALRKALEEQPEKYTFGTPLLDLFKVSPGQIVHADAVAEPQTTHWEGCEAVHPECKTELERKSDAIQRLWKERDELRALNAELVEALRCADAMLSGANMDAKAVERKVSAALAKVEASK